MINPFYSIALTLFFVIDAFGNIPSYLLLLKPYSRKERKKIAIRELLFALILMFIFHYLGQILLTLLGVSKTTVHISTGIILFIIATRLIFSHEEGVIWKEQKPFIVPIATPMFAGPSVLSVIMLFAQDFPSDWVVLSAILAAWFLASVIFLLAEPIQKIFKDKGLSACQRLMGLIVAIIAIQQLLRGVQGLIKP